ncbi:MAG: FG-GAP repeat protein [Deltaproteobacteria bacterium]|nr:FG-GAP repeat protein [Deltaproteobacteria bacterium]
MQLKNGNSFFHCRLLHPIFSPFFFFFLLSVFFSIFAQQGHCAQVSLTWDPNSESDLAGYKIYSGVQSRNYSRNVDVGNTTSYTLTGLDLGVTYYIAATAYNTQGLESGFSNEVTYTASNCTYLISPSSASFSASGGSGSVSVTTQSGCNWGTSATASWVAINSVSGTGTGTMRYTVSPNSGTARSASLTVAGNVFTVTEAGPTSYIVTASAGSGGSISPSGQVSIPQGANQTFTITPNTGYRIAGVTVDGVSRGAITSYSFSSVTANHTIAASFTPISSPPAVIKSPVVSTGLATSVTLSSVTLNGTVNPNGLSTTYIFQWGRTTSYGNTTAVQSAGSGTINTAVTANLTGLTADRTYHYRLVATNSAGTSYGTDGTFTTRITSDVDFNNDGKTDILWRHKQNGQISVWYLNGITTTGSAVVADFPNLDWEIVGTGDFNGDGKTDILWRNKVSGDVRVWLMSGTTLVNEVLIYQGASLEWEITGTGDFSGDGKKDILWRHKVSGDLGVWTMDGTTFIRGGVFYQGVPLVWGIAGTGDFNNDGKTDILWRHTVSGDVRVWLMSGTTLVNEVLIYQGASLEWEITGTGDFSGDGKTDILWRHKVSGDVGLWTMNGTTFISGTEIFQGVPLEWMIVAP